MKGDNQVYLESKHPLFTGCHLEWLLSLLGLAGLRKALEEGCAYILGVLSSLWLTVKAPLATTIWSVGSDSKQQRGLLFAQALHRAVTHTQESDQQCCGFRTAAHWLTVVLCCKDSMILLIGHTKKSGTFR